MCASFNVIHIHHKNVISLLLSSGKYLAVLLNYYYSQSYSSLTNQELGSHVIERLRYMTLDEVLFIKRTSSVVKDHCC